MTSEDRYLLKIRVPFPIHIVLLLSFKMVIKSLIVKLVINVVVGSVGVLWAFRIFQACQQEFSWYVIQCALSELVLDLMGGIASSMDQEPMDVEVMCNGNML